MYYVLFFFFFQAEDGIRDKLVTGVQTCALPICFHPVRSIMQGVLHLGVSQGLLSEPYIAGAVFHQENLYGRAVFPYVYGHFIAFPGEQSKRSSPFRARTLPTSGRRGVPRSSCTPSSRFRCRKTLLGRATAET